MSVKCGHCKDRHDSVAQVLLCSKRSVYTERHPGETPTMAARGQVVKATQAEFARNVSVEDVSQARDRMFGANQGAHGSPVETPARTKTRAAEGMYRKAGTIYKVQKAVHGSGQNYAKRLVQVLANDPKTGKPKFKFKFEYAPGFVFELRKEHMLTIEQAKEFGALYGTCCVCGRTLTKEESIAAGIGPVCATKF